MDFDNFFYYHLLWTYVTPCLFAVIIAIGTSGNLLVIYVILSRPDMRTVTNLLLVNLAIADVAFLWLCVPFQAYKYFADGWLFSDALCKVVQYFLYVSAYVTIYTLVVISGIRYLTVVKSSSRNAWYKSKRNVICLATGTWFLTMTANIPALLAHTVKSHVTETTNYVYCGIQPEAMFPLLFSFFAVGYTVPLFIICILYLLIFLHLNRNQPSTINQKKSRDRNYRTLRITIMVVLAFGISWLPTHAQHIALYFGPLPEGFLYEACRVLWNVMSYGNSCANPIIYNLGSDKFRRCFREICCFKQTGKMFSRRQNEALKQHRVTRVVAKTAI